MTLILDKVSHSYANGQKTLQSLSLDVNKGEIVSLLGPSGCGKTTLLRLVAGLETLSAGEIRLNGEVMASPQHSPPPEKRPVGLVFQEGALFPSMSVAENIEFGLGKLSRADKSERRDGLLKLIDLERFGPRKPHTLSGGQQQRVAVARALAPRPAIMLFDEPYASIDAVLRRELRESARAMLKKTDAISILVTHDPDEALEMSDRIAIMGKGRILQIGTPEAVMEAPRSADVAMKFGEAQSFRGKISNGRFVTEMGDLQLPSESNEDAQMLVARPEGLRFSPTEGGSFRVDDIRYRSSGWVLHLVGKTGGPSIRVAAKAGQPIPQPGEIGEIDILPQHAFLFADEI